MNNKKDLKISSNRNISPEKFQQFLNILDLNHTLIYDESIKLSECNEKV